MTLDRVQFIIAFWQRLTGRAAPDKVLMTERMGPCKGVFYHGEVWIHPRFADDETVFHELVHWEQWQDGRLQFVQEPVLSGADFPREVLHDGYHCALRGGYYLFNGQRVDDLPYEDRPAEIEARTIAKERLENFQRCRAPFETPNFYGELDCYHQHQQFFNCDYK